MMQEYRINKGASNFRPMEPVWPVCQPESFSFTAKLDISCWWSEEDWQGDKDRDDWNKLCGATSAFGMNNRRSAMFAWRPADAEGVFLVTAYTNDKRGRAKWGAPGGGTVDVRAGEVFSGECFLHERGVAYYHLYREGGKAPMLISHGFDTPWHRVYRQIGTYFGGADNEPGPYGGKAHKDMRLWLDFKWDN